MAAGAQSRLCTYSLCVFGATYLIYIVPFQLPARGVVEAGSEVKQDKLCRGGVRSSPGHTIQTSPNDTATPACQAGVGSSTALQLPKTQAALILPSSLSRVIQEDVRQGRRAESGVQVTPTCGATESVQGAALSRSSGWDKRARHGIPVCAAEQRTALPPSGRGRNRGASSMRLWGGCQALAAGVQGLLWV